MSVRVFKTKWFAALARGERITDDRLCEAIERAERGLIDADLGGGLIKQRVARPGQGRRGGYRVIVAYQPHRLALFLYGFAKNERDNIKDNELASFRDFAADWCEKDEVQLQQAIKDDGDEEIHCDQKAEQN